MLPLPTLSPTVAQLITLIIQIRTTETSLSSSADSTKVFSAFSKILYVEHERLLYIQSNLAIPTPGFDVTPLITSVF